MSVESPSDGAVTSEVVKEITQPLALAVTAPLHAGTSETGEEAERKVRALGRKKLAIVGFAPGTYGQAPFHDASWDVWSLNEAYTLPGFTRADRWFEIHVRDEVDISTRDPNHINWIRARRDMPIYMIRKFEDIPMSVSYPIKEVVKHFAKRGSGADYLTNTISYMLALAVYEKQMGLADWEYIGVWGVDMAQGGTYGQPSEYCVGPETRVLTADMRWIPAKDVAVGSKVMAFDEKSPGNTSRNKYRRWRVATVEATGVITRPSYRVHLSDGTSVVCSQEHRWLTIDQATQTWKATDKLHGGAHPTKLMRVLDVWDEDRSFDAGYLAAGFDGEGHLSQRPGRDFDGHTLAVGFAQKDNAMRSTVMTALEERGFSFGPEYEQGDVGKYSLRGGRSAIMRFLGQIRPKRLLENFDPDLLGALRCKEEVAVDHLEYLGEQSVVALKTSEGTFIAEGLASHNSEQRPSCEFWLGQAAGAGIYVYLPPNADMLHAPGLYGYEQDGSRMRMKMRGRVTELQGRIGGLSQQLQILNQNRMGMLGEVTLIQNLQWNPDQEVMKAALKERHALLTTQIQQIEQQASGFQRQLNQLEGAVDDTLFWLRSYTLPTHTQENLTDLDERPHAALAANVMAPKEGAPA